MMSNSAGGVPSQSYRQVGKRISGKLAKGVPQQGEDGKEREKRTTSSIPSKFDTVLYAGSRESNAFGNRCLRFDPKPSTNHPGPGSYDPRSATMLRDERTCGSVSHLGYSVGFVSRTRRFIGVEDDGALPTPGPGNYETDVQRETSHNRAGTTRIFAAPRQFRDDPLMAKEETPGPGQYNPTTVAGRGVRRTKPTSSFRSTSKRGFKPAQDAPAPGAYSTPESFSVLRGGQPSAAFRSSTNRQSALASGGGSHVPGPGAYEGTTRAPARRKPAQASSMFANVGQDRFGRPYIQKCAHDELPGPGAYTQESAPMYKALASSSYFVSDVPRMSATKRVFRPPGPAYYKPERVASNKSFLLNASKKWV